MLILSDVMCFYAEAFTSKSCVEIVTHTSGARLGYLGCLGYLECLVDLEKKHQVVIAAGSHLFPFLTEKLSPPAPMVLQCNAGE